MRKRKANICLGDGIRTPSKQKSSATSFQATDGDSPADLLFLGLLPWCPGAAIVCLLVQLSNGDGPGVAIPSLLLRISWIALHSPARCAASCRCYTVEAIEKLIGSNGTGWFTEATPTL
ncbi:hypothetical protein PG999_003562 [Apiospora kogelbergensis]|uniref:Uncharacterized protein n=1 Tax=Apiospora kogelbergensis TaxID=1337665 RepID=A0AAW0R3Z3_9PEZI